MKNSSGSALAIALGMMIIFSGLGLGALEYSGRQGQMAAGQVSRLQAFWLADGGIERARVQLPAMLLTENTDVNNYLRTTLAAGYLHRWNIDSKRMINGQSQRIKALASDMGFNIVDAVTYKGSLEATGSSSIIGTWQAVPGLTFESIFGMSMASVYALPGTTKYTNDNVPNGGYSGLSYLSVPSGATFSGNNGLAGSGFLIIDCGTFTGTCLTAKKGSFSGIIWVTGSGDVDFTGSSGGGIQGAVFTETPGTTVFTGNSSLAYNEQAVYDAEAFLPGGHPTTVLLFSWVEAQ